MKVKFDTLTWDRIDEDRWITASIATLIFLLLTFLIFNSIQIPQNPKKVAITEEIDFVKPEVKKKVVEEKKIEEKITEEKITEEDPEIILNLFMNTPTNIENLPQNLKFDTDFKIFEKENASIEEAQAITQIADGLLLDNTDVDPIDVPKGLSAEWADNNASTTIITPTIGNKTLNENVGISTTIKTKTHRLSNDFSGFKGNIEWEKLLDPIFEWIRKNAGPIGRVPTFFITDNDPTARTAKTIISIGNVQYELLLASKEEKRELKICLVNLETQEFVKLTDVGLTQTSSVFNTGLVRRQDDGEIFNFSKGTYHNADNPKAQEFMKVFWQWAKSVTGKG
ncbi:MAG: hypothetical protein MUC94_00030 [bacterium]|nr:hypothetical protein [bacterium]